MSILLEIPRNRSLTLQLDFTRDGQPLSLDGQTIIFTVARLPDQPAEFAALRAVSGEEITHSPTPGRAILSLTQARTAALDPLISYYGDVALLDAGGRLVPVDGLSGTVVVTSTVSSLS